LLVFTYLLYLAGVTITPNVTITLTDPNNLNEPLDPFPFWVAAEQKGGQG